MSLSVEVVDKLKQFQDGFRSGRLGHAYLIVGDPRGNAGQLAENILQMLFCSHDTNRPCGGCNNCRRVARRIHPDIVRVEPIKKSRGILVEQIEEVIRNIFQTTFEGGWKAVVFVDAERMNNEAANKLLKTLEEPPPRSVFLLLSDQPEALLPTIISRCQRVALSDYLTDPEDELRSAVFSIAGGTVNGRTAARLLKAREMLALLESIRGQAASETAEWLRQSQVSNDQADDLEEIGLGRTEAIYREKRRQVLRLLLLWQRDLLLCACGLGDDDLLFYRSAAGQIRAAASGLTCSQAMNNIKVVEKMQAHLNQHLPETMVIERALLQLSVRSDASERARGEREYVSSASC
ncbi:MAG: DNA polymerase III subunit [Kiritimatiellia bacterium]|nr:DNA polymerase III subunit [Kiritimatiellia bacterium]